MNRNIYKKMKNYKEIKEFSQNGYIRIAYMNELCTIRKPAVGKGGRKFVTLLPERLDIIRCIDSDKKSHMEVVEG